jgi:hypothetical protein
MELKELNVTNASKIQQLNSEEGNEDLDYLRIELLRKRIQEQEKSGQKYVIFVVALPLIGVIGLSILGALNYEYNSFQGEKCDKLPIVDCSSDPCNNNGSCINVNNHFSAVHVLLSRFYLNFILILSRFHPNFVQILS